VAPYVLEGPRLRAGSSEPRVERPLAVRGHTPLPRERITAFGRFGSGLPGFWEGARSAKMDPYRLQVGARGHQWRCMPCLRALCLRIPRAGRPDFSETAFGVPIFSGVGVPRGSILRVGANRPRSAKISTCGPGFGGIETGATSRALVGCARVFLTLRWPYGIAAFGRFSSGLPGFSEGAPSAAKIDPYRSEVGARGYLSPASPQPPSLRASWLWIPRVGPIFQKQLRVGFV